MSTRHRLHLQVRLDVSWGKTQLPYPAIPRSHKHCARDRQTDANPDACADRLTHRRLAGNLFSDARGPTRPSDGLSVRARPQAAPAGRGATDPGRSHELERWQLLALPVRGPGNGLRRAERGPSCTDGVALEASTDMQDCRAEGGGCVPRCPHCPAVPQLPSQTLRGCGALSPERVHPRAAWERTRPRTGLPLAEPEPEPLGKLRNRTAVGLA